MGGQKHKLELVLARLSSPVDRDIDIGAHYPNFVFIQVCGFNGREYTYEMAYGMIKKFGSGLLRLGAKRGDVLGMVVPNFPEFPIAFFGAAGVGVTLTTMNPTYRPGENIQKIG